MKGEVITEMAEYDRIGHGWEYVHGAAGWWDPRKSRASQCPGLDRSCIHTVSRFNHQAILINGLQCQAVLLPEQGICEADTNQSCTTRLLEFFPTIDLFTSVFFDAPQRQIYWSLEYLAVDPGQQSRGHCRKLVDYGLELAKNDPVGDLPACVISADGKEKFYQKCGYEHLVGWSSKASDAKGVANPLRKYGIEGGAVLWTR